MPVAVERDVRAEHGSGVLQRVGGRLGAADGPDRGRQFAPALGTERRGTSSVARSQLDVAEHASVIAEAVPVQPYLPLRYRYKVGTHVGYNLYDI